MPSKVYEPGTVEPGVLTSEFIQSTLLQVISLAVAVVSIFAPGFSLDSLTALVPAVSVLIAGITQVAYTISRSRIKNAATRAAAELTH